MNKKIRNGSFLLIALAVFLLYGLFVWQINSFAEQSLLEKTFPVPARGGCISPALQIEDVDASGKQTTRCVSSTRAKIEAWSKLGPVGDSFGIINSVFGTLTLAILLLTLMQQRQQLDEQRKQFDDEKKASMEERAEAKEQHCAIVAAANRQVHDRRVFDWIDLHHRMIERVELTIGRNGVYGSRKGAQAINHLFNAILFETGNLLLNASDPSVNQKPDSINVTAISDGLSVAMADCVRQSKPRFRAEIEKVFCKHRNSHDNEIGHIFRNAYRLLKWINDESDISESVKWEYASTFRAQLSFGELSLMLLNCATEDTKKAASLFSHYGMFENLPKKDLLVVAYSDDARFFPEAFDGELAKHKLGLTDKK
jgi:Putative phage abortive infection protein